MTNKQIAVITGASSGIGYEFAENIAKLGSFDEVWLIARRRERLEEVKLPFKTRVIPLDLSQKTSYDEYTAILQRETPDIKVLINASGFGKFGATQSIDLAINLNMIDLNCGGVMAMCQNSLPYMSEGAKILNIASVAAFQPIPYINVYAATKAFVLSYSRGLGGELKSKGITVTAVCPFWTKTEFFDRAIEKDSDAVVKKYTAMYTSSQIVNRAIRDAKRGKDVSKFGFVARAQAGLAKLLPHKFIMWYWKRQQKLK